jgi:hypothetical protein
MVTYSIFLPYRNLMQRITPAEVRAACEMLSRLSDRQWNDASRRWHSAAGAAPFIQRIHQKIDEDCRWDGRPIAATRASACGTAGSA